MAPSETSMHSGTIRAARRLTVFGGLPIGGWGSACPWPCGRADPFLPRVQTDACQNITFPQLRLRAVIITKFNIWNCDRALSDVRRENHFSFSQFRRFEHLLLLRSGDGGV